MLLRYIFHLNVLEVGMQAAKHSAKHATNTSNQMLVE